MDSAANRIVVNATTRHTATVIFAHGLGDTGNGWLFLVENFRRRQLFPEIKFILPTAPVIPITFVGGLTCIIKVRFINSVLTVIYHRTWAAG